MTNKKNMKILKNSLFAVALLGMVACNQNANNETDESKNEAGVTQNDSIANTDNPPPSRDLSTVEGQDLTPEDNTAESALKFTETSSQMKLILPNADVFEDGKADFKSGAQSTLEEAYKVINGRGIGKVLVSGNSGNEGDPAQNRTLSTQRAMAIANWLKSKDIKKDITISSQGVGDTYPMISYELKDGSPNPQANELNNRTEITFRKSQTPTE